MSADLQLAMADFVAAFHDDPHRALCDLQALFLDERACLARIAYFRTLADRLPGGSLAVSPERSTAAFAAEIQALREEGLFPAWAKGLLQRERLLALTCDPHALWQAHCAVADLPLPLEEPEPTRPRADLPDATRYPGQIDAIWPAIHQAREATPADAASVQRVILQRYRLAIYRYLLASLGNAGAADELCQEFSLRFLRGDFRPANPEATGIRALLRAALSALIIDHHRRRQSAQSLAREGAEPAADSLLDSDRQFLDAWQADLLNKAWDALAEEERRSGQPLHTVLHFRASHPEQRSAQMAGHLSSRLGKEVTADWVRKWLHAARERFAELLLAEVSSSLRDPTPESVVQELIDLELFEYCKVAVERWRQKREESP
jgi:RNA polymerase sigma-70 factor (ECF subfamily)